MPESLATSYAMTTELISTRQDSTLVLTLNNPASRNTLSPAVYTAAVAALDEAARDPTLRAIVLTGAGGHFSGGGNLNQLAAVRGQPEVQAARVDALHGWIAAMRAHPLPVIAAVEGAAAGAGCSLALACDLLVASTTARFGLAYGRIGASPDGGVVQSLMQLLPRQQALEWLWLAQVRSGADLQRAGLVNRLTDPGQALDEALALAAALAQFAPNVIASVKRLSADAAVVPLATHLDRERDAFIANINHDNGGEGLAAWREKRAPQFR